MDKDSDRNLQTVQAIEERLSARTEDGFIYPKYMNHQFLPDELLTVRNFETAKNFRASYAQMDEFKRRDGSFDTGDYDTMQFLVSLSFGAIDSEIVRQKISQMHEQGRVANLDVLLPRIEEHKAKVDKAFAFLEPAAKLYEAHQRISVNARLRDSEYYKDWIDGADFRDISAAVTYVNTHNNPQLINAQIEVLEAIGRVAETYQETLQKIANLPDKGDSMKSIWGWEIPHSMGYCTLESRLDDFLGHFGDKIDIYKLDELLIEESAAGKYTSRMAYDALDAALTDKAKASELLDDYRDEYKNIHEGKNAMPHYQPRGHQTGQDINVSIANAKKAVLEKVGYKQELIDSLSKCVDELAAKSFANRVQEGREQGSGLQRGSERTEPTQREGGWSDNV